MARGSDNRSPLTFSCDCGTVTGRLSPVQGNHVVCYCADCRAAELFLNRDDPAPGPVDLFQTLPETISFSNGVAQIAAFRLSPRGPIRWYASCCKTPLFNTLASPKLPFCAIHSARLSDPSRIGRVTIRSFAPQPGGKRKTEGAARMVWSVLGRMAAARISGRWRHTPFFDDSGSPVAAPELISRDIRDTLYPDGKS